MKAERRRPELPAKKVLLYRSLEHYARAEVALDAGDFVEHQRQRSLARLEQDVANGRRP